jgi:hypothetical protein
MGKIGTYSRFYLFNPMADMRKENEHKQSWKDSELYCVRKIELLMGDSGDWNAIFLFHGARRDKSEVWPPPSGATFEVSVEFLDVSSIALQIHECPFQLTGFAIDSVRDRGWQETRYKVEDYENGLLTFYCRDYQTLMFRSLTPRN